MSKVAAAIALVVFTAVGLATIAFRAPAPARPVVLAAASLTEVLPRVEPDGRYSFGGSNLLAQQIRFGAPFDVFLSASAAYTQELHRAGLVREPVPFATNSLVLVVPRSNPQRLDAVADLASRPDLRLVVAGPKVPIGLYTRQVLARLGLAGVLARAVSQEPDVKGVVGKVALGEADAGFAYRTDVRPVAGKVRAIELPPASQPTVVYEAALATEPESSSAARSFLETLLAEDGRRALRAAGFGLP